MRKIVLIVAGVFLASFGVARVEGLATHRGYGGSLVWAQNWDDSTSADAVNSDATPPSVAGTYTGSVVDHQLGTANISIVLSQMGSKLSGSWMTDLTGNPSGSLSGTVKPNSKIHLKLSVSGHKHCALNFQGIFENGDEIAGVYHTNGCRQSDHGMVQMTD